jgi:hypothetical protein
LTNKSSGSCSFEFVETQLEGLNLYVKVRYTHNYTQEPVWPLVENSERFEYHPVIESSLLKQQMKRVCKEEIYRLELSNLKPQ